MTEPRLKVLEELEPELARAVHADARRGGARRWRRAPWRPTALFAALVLTGGGGIALGASLVLGDGDPIEAPRPADVAAADLPAVGSDVVAGVAARDPQGAPPWDVRVSRTAGGDVCTAVGQSYEGRFGVVGLDRRFRELPLGAADACGRPPQGSAVQAGARAELAGGGLTARTVLAGVAGPDVAALSAGPAAGRLAPVPLGSGRGFAAVFAGYPEVVRPVLRIRATDGRTRTLRLLDDGRDVALDPDGGPPWRLEVGRAEAVPTPAALRELRRRPRAHLPSSSFTRVAGRCVQLTRTPPSQPDTRNVAFGGPFGPLVCGDVARAPVAVAMRRLVPGTGGWGLSPARTLVWGAVRQDVARVELRAPGRPPQPVAIGARDRGIAAILPGQVDPRQVVLRLRLRDGRLVTQRGSTSLHGGRTLAALREPVPPPVTPVAAARRDLLGPFALVVPSTVRTSAPIDDPAGRAPWVLRTFLGDPSPDARKSLRPGQRFACWEVGQRVDGELRRPDATGDGPALTYGEADARCNADEPQPRVPVELFAYAQGATDYAPQVGRLVVSGLAPTARSAELLGLPGGARPLPLTGPGGFLAVLDPAEVSGPLRVRVHLASGRTMTSQALDTGGGAPTPVDARSPDPDGAAPWAITTGGPQPCTRIGQVLGGRLAYVDAATGAVQFGSGVASSCGDTLAYRPVSIGLQHVGDRSPLITGAQRQRRTLTGRTLLYGTVRPGITSLTIRTPRDVREVRPAGPGRGFIVAYDGHLTGGQVRVEPHGRGAGPVVTLPLDL